MEVLKRELIYFWYYFDILFRQIFWYWVIGIVIGSLISVVFKDKIHAMFDKLRDKRLGLFGVIPASILGIASPLCMYGTIPIAASFANKGMREDWLAAFMMSSILLNPQLIIYSAALGSTVLIIRILSCFCCGCLAGILVYIFHRKKRYFNFDKMKERESKDTDPNIIIRLLKNIGRNINATGLYFLIGIVLSALFQRYVPTTFMTSIFGSNEAWGVLMAATIGVPLYMCGGGTIPLLQVWLSEGMSVGSATSFMVTGPSTKITNLGALKSVLGIRNFIIYIVYVMLFSIITGLIINIII